MLFVNLRLILVMGDSVELENEDLPRVGCLNFEKSYLQLGTCYFNALFKINAVGFSYLWLLHLVCLRLSVAY